MTRAVVIGGTGFIGDHLCRALARRGAAVTSFSRQPPLRAIEHVTGLTGDVGCSEALAAACVEADCIYWVAGETTPADSVRDPGLEVAGNLLPLARFLTLIGGATPARLVYTSSGGTIYGECSDEGGPAETRAPAPVSYYGAGKAAAELFLQVFRHQHGNPVTLLRPANVYGPGQPLRARFGVIPAVLHALARESNFTRYGDGKQVRDFLYIDDAVDLLLRAGAVGAEEGGVSGVNGDGLAIYNLGSGAGVSLNTLIATAEAVTGRRLHLDYQPARAADLRTSVLDCQRVRARFGWAPATSLENGLRQTWQAMPEVP